mmetsp:Transcript_14353/g.31419  ORF Transcript_14353/g.31419 Transcript_14353/m.31419 type:complete len:82 (+) Transcript_14353:1324-1569(+)
MRRQQLQYWLDMVLFRIAQYIASYIASLLRGEGEARNSIGGSNGPRQNEALLFIIFLFSLMNYNFYSQLCVDLHACAAGSL